MYKIPELNIQRSPLEDVEDPTHSENWPRKGGITFILSFLIGYLRVLKLLMRKSSIFIEEFHLVDTEGIIEMEHQHFASPSEIMNLDNMVIKWLLKH